MRQLRVVHPDWPNEPKQVSAEIVDDRIVWVDVGRGHEPAAWMSAYVLDQIREQLESTAE